MTGIPKPAFERALVSLSRKECVAFVADLWAARGYRIDRGPVPGVVVATSPHRRDRVLYVPDLDAAGRGRTIDAPAGFEEREVTVVVPGTVIPEPGDGVTRCVGAETLYELAMYAIDRDALTDLCRSHFGQSPSSLAAEGSDRSGGSTWTGFGSRHRVAVLGMLALAVVLATTLVWAGGNGLRLNTDTTVPETQTGTATVGTPLAATPDPEDLESSCPDPPTGVSPGILQPRPGGDTLDGWRVVDSRVVSIFDLMNRSQEATPKESFVGTYIGPDDRAYKLRISWWADPATARAEGANRRALWPVWEVWGAYSFGVRAAPNATAPSTSLTRAAARELLAAVDAPGDADLAACVDDLVEDRG